ncbi:hypothetical protein AgCh_018833 [Apium graveolens]
MIEKHETRRNIWRISNDKHRISWLKSWKNRKALVSHLMSWCMIHLCHGQWIWDINMVYEWLLFLLKRVRFPRFIILRLKGNSWFPWRKDGLSFLPSSIPITEIRDFPKDLLGVHPGVSDLLTGQFSHVQKDDWILFNTFLELENEVVNWLSSKWKIMTIGPSVPSMFLDKRLADDRDYGLSLFKPDGDACIKWLDGKDTDSVVYVSFGSLANLEQDYMDEIAWGLLDSKCSFIWVVRDTEKSKLSEKFVEESADRGLIVNWSPQLEVLAHKAVGSFMTHCGWNSTLEALSLGVPMMVVPQWTDQTTNAKYIVDVWQTGVRVKAHDKEKITREDVTKSVKDVMEGTKREELKANALKFKEMALEAMSEGGSSDKNIDDFIAEIVTSSTST